jgi:ABC-type multidrug transport system ATPase subunit
MGASAAGKSLLLKVLAGRLPGLHFTGDIFMEGKVVDPKQQKNDIAFVPHEDFLISELTPRETIRNSFRMKRDESDDIAEVEVSNLLKKFGLDPVADKVIGTVFKRVLSGGQKKRVEVCSELIAPSSILVLDEPLSGLDGGTAYDVLLAIKETLNDHQGDVSILMSIHQPNSRVVELFDHVLLLSEGGMLFFGTMNEAIAYFTETGFPSDVFTPTDIFLRVTDPNFGISYKFDFEGTFAGHPLCLKLNALLGEVSRYGASHQEELVDAMGDIELGERKSLLNNKVAPTEEAREAKGVEEEGAPRKKISVKRLHWRPLWMFAKQYWILFTRHCTLAFRDSSLYYLQFCLATFLLLLIGGDFFKAKGNLAEGFEFRTRPIIAFIFSICYLQVFKVFYLHKIGQLFDHEKINKTYYPLAFWLAELTASCIFVLVFIPGLLFAHLLIGLPIVAFPFLMFVYWMTALAAESMLNLVSKLITDVTMAVFVSEGIMVMLTVFVGQSFIIWDECPIFWRWLQEIAVFTQSSRAAMLGLHDYYSYTCAVNSLGVCVAGSNVYPCESPPSNGYCTVSGREAFYLESGIPASESKWKSFGYLTLIFVVCRVLVLVLDYYPFDKIVNKLKVMFAGALTQSLLDSRQEIRRLRGQLNSHLISHAKNEVEQSKVQVQQQSVKEKSGDRRLERYLDPTCNSYEPLGKGCSLEWKDLTVTLKDKAGTVLVDKVAGAALPGRILALMGPSGAGKTTLMNALSHRTPFARMEGEVTFGKRKFLPSDLMYVPQFDEFNPNLTVLEQILMVGELKCADRKEMLLRLNSLLSVLGLADKVNLMCRDLTRGEIKRVSVGMGMIANPNVLFLDELDSSAAYSIIKFLNQLTSKVNVAVMIAIHQPAPMVFDLIHDVYLLNTGGRLAYYGPACTVAGYFSGRGYPSPRGVNPTDYMMDLMNRPPVYRGRQTDWTDLYNMSSFARNFRGAVYLTIKLSTKAPLPPEPPAFSSRLLVLFKFFLRYYIRERGMYWFRIGFLVISAVYLGSLFYQLTPSLDNITGYFGAIFFTVWTVLFAAVASTEFFAADFHFTVEQIKNAVVTPALYCVSQFVMSLPFNFAAAVVFQSIFHYMTDVYPDSENYTFGIMLNLAHLLLMEASMLCSVTIFKNAMLGVTSSIVMLCMFFLFSGLVVPKPIIPPSLRWLLDVTPTQYSLLAYIALVFSNQKFTIPQVPGYLLPGSSIIASLAIDPSLKPWNQLGIMFGFVLAIRVLHFILLWVHVYPYVSYQLDWLRPTSLLAKFSSVWSVAK